VRGPTFILRIFSLYTSYVNKDSIIYSSNRCKQTNCNFVFNRCVLRKSMFIVFLLLQKQHTRLAMHTANPL